MGHVLLARSLKILLQNGVRHVTSAVYKPATNGLAEWIVQTFKAAIATITESISNLLPNFIFKYKDYSSL